MFFDELELSRVLLLLLRFEIRDSVMVEKRAESGRWYPKQNVALSVGYAWLGKKGGS